MKKLSITLALLMVIGASVAFASSLAVPWFADNAPTASGWPPPAPGVTTLVYLKNNLAEDVIAEIEYFSAIGEELGPVYPDNTFVIPALSTVAFRPVANDPVAAGGQESAVAVLIPDRPRDVNPAKNGSATISWVGGPNDIQGMVASASSNISYAHLLPPGQ